jgi:ankyrin repeat protein
MNAASKGFYSGVKLLIDKGADVNITSIRTNRTALTLAMSQNEYNFSVYKNYKKIIDLLMNSGADLNIGVDNLNDYKHSEEYIRDKYPEQYKEYLLKKQTEKYNL